MDAKIIFVLLFSVCLTFVFAAPAIDSERKEKQEAFQHLPTIAELEDVEVDKYGFWSDLGKSIVKGGKKLVLKAENAALKEVEELIRKKIGKSPEADKLIEDLHKNGQKYMDTINQKLKLNQTD